MFNPRPPLLPSVSPTSPTDSDTRYDSSTPAEAVKGLTGQKHRFFQWFDIGTTTGAQGQQQTVSGLAQNAIQRFNVQNPPDWWIISLLGNTDSLLNVWLSPDPAGPPIRMGIGGSIKIPAQGKNYLCIQNVTVAVPAVNAFGTVIAVAGFDLATLQTSISVNPSTVTQVTQGNATAATEASLSGNNSTVVSQPGNWAQTSAPVAGAQATTSRAAGAGTTRHVCTGFIIDGAANNAAPAATVLTWNLRDGASGAGTVLATGVVTIPASATFDMVPIVVSGLNLIGSAATAMTLEYAAGLANFLETVSLFGYDVS